jgi:hypothetical protein
MVTFCRLIGNSLLLDIDFQPDDETTGHIIRLEPVWHVWSAGRVLVNVPAPIIAGENNAASASSLWHTSASNSRRLTGGTLLRHRPIPYVMQKLPLDENGARRGADS